MENTLETFADDLFLFLTGQVKRDKSLLVKKHSENLQVLGDFSFPNGVKSWLGILQSQHISNVPDLSLMKFLGKEISDLIKESKKWNLSVKKAKEEKGRVYVFLHRNEAIRVGLSESLKNNEIITQQMHQNLSFVLCDPLCEDTKCLTSLRLQYLSKTIQNLYSISADCREKAPNVFISFKSSSKSTDRRIILCGTVLNARTGVKETTLSADDFIRIRQAEMTLIAQHKYGVRVSTDSKWKEFISHLGESAVVFELLQTKPSSAVKINFDCSSAGSSKGAAFILYNCARLETIVRTYNEKVVDGTYPPLPDFDDIDFNLLTQEDEWNLVFNYVLGLPSLLNNCVEVNERICEFRPHLICGFLCSMVRVFSQYYRKTRILTEPRKHLLPVMFARIHLLTILNNSLKTCLTILNIKSVSQMYIFIFYLPFCSKLLF